MKWHEARGVLNAGCGGFEVNRTSVDVAPGDTVHISVARGVVPGAQTHRGGAAEVWEEMALEMPALAEEEDPDEHERQMFMESLKVLAKQERAARARTDRSSPLEGPLHAAHAEATRSAARAASHVT